MVSAAAYPGPHRVTFGGSLGCSMIPGADCGPVVKSFRVDGLRTVQLSADAGGDDGLPSQSQVCADLTLPKQIADNIVIVTHGWNGWSGEADLTPFGSIGSAIQSYLEFSGKSILSEGGWDVLLLDWSSLAGEAEDVHGSEVARFNAQLVGFCLGDDLRGYEKIHMIAHSAGTTLIDAATKQLNCGAPSPFVFLTMLDAYTATALEAEGSRRTTSNITSVMTSFHSRTRRSRQHATST